MPRPVLFPSSLQNLRRLLAFVFFIFVFAGTFFSYKTEFVDREMSVILETTKGDLTVDLYIEARPKSEYIISYMTSLAPQLGSQHKMPLVE